MKRMLVAVLGCVVVLAGCGSSNTADSAEAQSTAENVETMTLSETGAVDETDEVSTESAGGEFSLGEELTPDDNGVISNGFITITMPSEYKGTYLAYNYENDINIYDKASNEAGYGGFIFGVSAADDYAKYGGMRTKIGELTEKNGKLYHILISYPSEVQWDYTKSEEMPESYKAINDKVREIASTVTSADGGTYVDGAGTKGEDIYGALVKDIKGKIENAKDAGELEAENLSAVYYAMTQGDEAKDPMESIGISYVDFNLDGVDEMLIGDVESKEIYDIFASVDGEPAHVISGSWRDYYKVYGPVLAEYTHEGADVGVISTYSLLPNSTELSSQYSIKIDETEGAENKWSVSYDDGDNWEALTEEDYKQRLSNIEDFTSDKPITFTKLGDIK